MNRFALLFALLLPLCAFAQQVEPLEMPVSPRIMGLAGAYTAVADDPEAGFLNPSGLRLQKQIGYNLFFGTSTHTAPDQLGVALSNPGSESGQAFAMGIWTQGWTRHRDIIYYVPYSGTSLDVTSTTHLGLVLRAPYISSRIPGISSGWETVGDVALLQTFDVLRVGAAVERAFGGGRGFIPRRLKLGAAFVSPSSGVTLAYEWQGDEGPETYHFGRSSSRYGAEAPVGKFVILRGGYIAAARHRVAFGLAIGNIKAGWRIEGGWEVPAATHGETRWVAGMGYRI